MNSVTASFGIATKQEDETTADVIARADSHLNQAKQLGRNRVLPIN
ncbi:diguanylate cyclase domain-containing protein [Photobacterium sp. OFAV2-7]